MQYTREDIIKRMDNGERLKFLFFWGHQPDKSDALTKTCFSQWWPSPFKVDGIEYLTAEHWMMAKKALLFNDMAAHEKVLACKTAAEAKKIGRTVTGFDEEVYLQYRYQIVLQGSLYKFNSDPELKEFLLNTGDRILVEASPVDAIWGIGLPGDNEKANSPHTWRGLNLLGFALTEARDIIKQQKN